MMCGIALPNAAARARNRGPLANPIQEIWVHEAAAVLLDQGGAVIRQSFQQKMLLTSRS